MDRRQFRRLKRRKAQAELKINTAVWNRMKELMKDKELAAKIEDEMKNLKTPKDYNDYIRRSHDIARDEVRSLAGRSFGS